MVLKHKDIVIPPEQPFINCKLRRKPYAETLTNLVNNHADGFVLSVNTPWGTGKTTFIKMWQAYLKLQGSETIYFNAWENDFDSDPMVALMSELGTLTNEKTENTFKSVVKKGAVILPKVIPTLLKAIVAKYTEVEELKTLFEGLAEGTAEIMKEEIDEYARKKKGLVEFRTALEQFVAERTPEKPLVIFIDEMDRCRPNYAVELLEKVKHFFSVPGIVFVLAIDKEQLGNAIKGFYGSEQFNSNEYLRRFIDLEFKLPNPPAGLYSEYLFEYFQFEEFFSKKRRQQPEHKSEKDNFKYLAKSLFKHLGFNLRYQEKVFAQARVVLSTFKSEEQLIPLVYLFLVYCKDCRPDFYQELADGATSPQGILDLLAKILPNQLHEGEEKAYILLEAQLIIIYANHHMNKVPRFPDLVDEDGKLLVRPFFDKSRGYEVFKSYIIDEQRGNRYLRGMAISHLIEKIDFLDNFQTE